MIPDEVPPVQQEEEIGKPQPAQLKDNVNTADTQQKEAGDHFENEALKKGMSLKTFYRRGGIISSAAGVLLGGGGAALYFLADDKNGNSGNIGTALMTGGGAFALTGILSLIMSYTALE